MLKLTFDANAADTKAETVYFNISAEEWEKICKCQKDEYINFEFINIPELPTPRTVVEVDHDTLEITKPEWKYAYIVVNVAGTAITVATNNVKTSINGVSISKDLNEKHNNEAGVTSLLYNFSKATSVKLGKNFQGTIFAPNAAVTDYAGNGHLSGALVAKRNLATDHSADLWTSSVQQTSRKSQSRKLMIIKHRFPAQQWGFMKQYWILPESLQASLKALL